MIMGIHKKFSNSREYYSTNRCRSKYPTNIQQEMQGTSEGTLGFESTPENIFDYSLGGYYHRERWART
jgi:hypothetical protein